MKKLLAMIITISMLLSLAVLLCVPAAAVDGMWEVYASSGVFRDDFDPVEDDYIPVPGYKYTSEGLQMIPADWKDFSPKAAVQTKDKVSLKDGVYLLIRADQFTYEGDKWFTYSISDTKYASIGSTNTVRDGEMLTALMRPDNNGKINSIQWNKAAFVGVDSNAMSNSEAERYDNGMPLFELIISWDNANNTYKVTINGTDAPEGAIAWLNEKFGTDDMAYVGMNCQNSIVGGTAALSVLKFGTSKDTATVPQGDDSREPENHYLTIAEKTDPATIPAGQPGLILNASREHSDSKGTVTNKPGSMTSITEENYIHYTSDRANLEIGFSVKYEKTIDIDDFPVIVVLTRNLCTCGESLEDCMAFETANMYIMCGETFSANDNEKVNTIDVCYDPIVRGDDSYLYFYVDTSDLDLCGFDANGRFNGARFDIKSIKTDIPGMNEFDICFLALFRDLDEAEAYINEFVGSDEGTDVPGDIETGTEAPVQTDTEAPEQGGNVDTEAPEQGGNVVDTEAPEQSETETEAAASAGCASSVGFGMIALITLAGGASFVAFKKRR